MKSKDKCAWSRTEKFVYGNVIHVAFEYLFEEGLSSFRVIIASFDAFQTFLVDNLLFTRNEMILKEAFEKIKSLNVRKLNTYIEKYKSQNYKVLTEMNMIFPLVSSGSLVILRPDVLLFNIQKKKLIVVELKSGKSYNRKQLSKYKRNISRMMEGWDVSVVVYLAGEDQIITYRL